MSFQFDISPTGVLSHAQFYYNPNTHKVVPKDAVVLDLIEATSHMSKGLDDLSGLLEQLSFDNGIFAKKLADQIEAQTKPPRIPEPGWGEKVIAHTRWSAERAQWVRWMEEKKADDETLAWKKRNGGTAAWKDLIDPVLVKS